MSFVSCRFHSSTSSEKLIALFAAQNAALDQILHSELGRVTIDRLQRVYTSHEIVVAYSAY